MRYLPKPFIFAAVIGVLLLLTAVSLVPAFAR
jgi:hypothetical protein